MVTVEKCSCGHPSCSYYWLVGLGNFVQGSGFSKKEADTIAQLWNERVVQKEAREDVQG